MADYCELTVKFAPMPRARLAARRNAFDILAAYLLDLEAIEQEGTAGVPDVLKDENVLAMQSVYQQSPSAG